MSALKTTTLLAVVALLVAPAAVALALVPAAWAHVPFKNGPESARQIAKVMNRSADFTQVRCRYLKPHIRCAGMGRWGKTDGFLAMTISVHKTAPRRGHAFICVNSMGICKRQALRFSS